MNGLGTFYFSNGNRSSPLSSEPAKHFKHVARQPTPR
jgi:hypothetical protein